MPDQRLEDAWLPLRESRAELMGALGDTLPRPPSDDPQEFPRSRLLRAVMHQKKSTVWLVGLGVALWAVNPRLAARLARRVPVRLIASRLLR